MSFLRIPEKYDPWLIALLSLLFFLPGLGQVHLFDWDEINFAECAREMIASGNYLQVQINFEPFWEKPPLFFWMQVLSMKVFGINEFAARFPNALAGLIGLLAMYFIGKKWKDRRFALLWTAAYFGSLLPHLYFRSGIIDPWFNLFIFGSLYAWIRLSQPQSHALKWAIFGGVLLGLGVLTKGPVAGLILGLCVLIFWLLSRFRELPNWRPVGAFILLCVLTIASWFGLEWYQNGPWFTKTFVEYQIRLLSTEDAGHGGFPGYHFVVLLLGCFPAGSLGLRAWFKKVQADDEWQMQRWMRILFWVVLILFSLVQSKIVHYSSLCYYPLTFLAALQIYSWLDKGIAIPKLEKWTTLGIGGIWVIACLALPFLGMHPQWIKPLLSQDPFAMANMQADVVWTYWQLIPGLFLLGLLIWFFGFRSKRGLIQWDVNRLFFGTAIFLFLALAMFINRIEGYSQRAVIEFYKEHQGEDAYFQPMGYKSYAHLWYSRVPANHPPESKDKGWLLSGDIDKNVYFITKITKEGDLAQKPELEKVWEKNGFVVFLRRVGE
ncbi:MAG: glycosyltransferase family 39 protein [Bacteroidetes bacterium]|nr:glycosyltransferase family 39 protein [Bacteroidota bacterium]